MLYSPSTNGFYPETDTYPNLPLDTIEISQDLYFNLLSGGNEGKEIVAGDDGVPYLSDPKPPTKEKLIQTAEIIRADLSRAATEKIAPLQDAVDLDDATAEEKKLLCILKQYRVALNRLDLSTAPDITWPTPPED